VPADSGGTTCGDFAMRRLIVISILTLSFIAGGCAMTCPNRLHNFGPYADRRPHQDRRYKGDYLETKLVSFTLDQPGVTTVLIVDKEAAVIDTVLSQYLESGEHQYLWDGQQAEQNTAEDLLSVRVVQGDEITSGEILYLRTEP